MAFHLWDAVAFFSPSLETILHKSPSTNDLTFQHTIQSLVKEFMHQPKNSRSSNNNIIRTLDQSSPLTKDTQVHTSVPISVNINGSHFNGGQNQSQPVVTSDTSTSNNNTTNNSNILQQHNATVKNESSQVNISSPSKHRRDSLSLLPSSSPDEILVINGSSVSYIAKYKEIRCSFWQSQGLLEYAWVS